MSLTEPEEKNLATTTYMVQKDVNPDPIFMALACVGVLLILVCLYYSVAKKSMSGNWISREGRKYVIYHSPLTGYISADCHQLNHHLVGYVDGVGVSLSYNGSGDGGMTGYWNQAKNKIEWINGPDWSRETYLAFY